MKIGKPIPKYGYFYQARCTGKTTKAVQEFMNRKDCLLIVQDEKTKKYTIDRFKIPKKFHENIQPFSNPESRFRSKRWDSLIIDDIWDSRHTNFFYIMSICINHLHKTSIYSSDVNLFEGFQKVFPIKLIENHLDN